MAFCVVGLGENIHLKTLDDNSDKFKYWKIKTCKLKDSSLMKKNKSF